MSRHPIPLECGLEVCPFATKRKRPIIGPIIECQILHFMPLFLRSFYWSCDRVPSVEKNCQALYRNSGAEFCQTCANMEVNRQIQK